MKTLLPMRTRAVSAIDLDVAPPAPRNYTYKVGDYWPDPNAVYNGGVLQSGDAVQGIVFWLDPNAAGYDDSGATPTGRSGKVVSLAQGANQEWGLYSYRAGSASATDGL